MEEPWAPAPAAGCAGSLGASPLCRKTVGAGAASLVSVAAGATLMGMCLGLGLLRLAWSASPASANDSRHGREDVGGGGTGLSVLGEVMVVGELNGSFCGR